MVINCEVITKADIGSDHTLVRMPLRINKRLTILKTIQITNLLISKHKKLKGSKESFEINLKTKNKQTNKQTNQKLEEEVTDSTFSEIMKEEANKSSDKTKEKTHVLSTEDQ